jgi:type IV pilus assembly protein PilW
VSLPGLLVAMSVSSAVLLASMVLLQLAREDFFHSHQSALLEERAGFALEVMVRTLRQAAVTRISMSDALPSAASLASMPFDVVKGTVQGVDNARVSVSAAGVALKSMSGINASDVLAIDLRSALGTPINCAGAAVPADAYGMGISGWVILHVALGPDGEPELHCAYAGQKKWDSQAILSGVEYFQVLFGLDTNDDGLPDQYLSASSISKQDANLPVEQSSLYQRVVAVHVALVLRSASGGSKPSLLKTMDLFGSQYTSAFALADPGTVVRAEEMSNALRSRLRRRMDAVIFLHHQRRVS